MELDITTLENTYIFLNRLQLQGFICNTLVFKVISKHTGKVTYYNFSTLEDFFNRYVSILTNNKPNRYCVVGDFIFLENIKFNNNAVKYELLIYFYNISTGLPTSKIDIHYNNNKNEFYSVDHKKYVSYLHDELLAYFARNTYLKTTRESAYVDACYVNPYYVESNSTGNATDSIGLE